MARWGRERRRAARSGAEPFRVVCSAHGRFSLLLIGPECKFAAAQCVRRTHEWCAKGAVLEHAPSAPSARVHAEQRRARRAARHAALLDKSAACCLSSLNCADANGRCCRCRAGALVQPAVGGILPLHPGVRHASRRAPSRASAWPRKTRPQGLRVRSLSQHTSAAGAVLWACMRGPLARTRGTGVALRAFAL